MLVSRCHIQTLNPFFQRTRSKRIALAAVVLLSGAYLDAQAAGVAQDNVVIVVDASGSMGDAMRSTGTRKMDAAKTALKEVLAQVPEATQIGLLVFSARNLQDPWAYPLGPRDDAALLAAIDLPEPGGGTPLGKNMKIAADRLIEEREKQYGYGTYRLLIVTDGNAQDQRLVQRFTPDIMARGITIDVIGVDMQDTHTLATQVHSYRRADDPESLKSAIADVFAEVTKGDDGTAQSDAFEVIAPLPFETAASMIAALGASGNHPIGESPGSAAARPAQPASQSSSAQAPSTTQPSAPQPASQQSTKSSGGTSWWTYLFVILIVVLIARGSGKKRRRRK